MTYWRDRRSAYVRFAAAAVNGLAASRPDLQDRALSQMAWEIAGHMIARWDRFDWPDHQPKPVPPEKSQELEQLRLEVKALRVMLEAKA